MTTVDVVFDPYRGRFNYQVTKLLDDTQRYAEFPKRKPSC